MVKKDIGQGLIDKFNEGLEMGKKKAVYDICNELEKKFWGKKLTLRNINYLREKQW